MIHRDRAHTISDSGVECCAESPGGRVSYLEASLARSQWNEEAISSGLIRTHPIHAERIGELRTYIQGRLAASDRLPRLVSVIRAEFPGEAMMTELHILRAILSVERGDISLEDIPRPKAAA